MTRAPVSPKVTTVGLLLESGCLRPTCWPCDLEHLSFHSVPWETEADMVPTSQGCFEGEMESHLITGPGTQEFAIIVGSYTD